MNKSHLIETLAHKAKLTPKEAENVVNVFLDAIIEGFVNGERTELRGFGTFKVKQYKSYMGRNPKSGTAITVKAKRLPFFKPGKQLRLLVDQDT
ncbi:MAG: integration host factor subunit beta [Deltaproteobacteria bacterium]|jgi:integration host factor subunit beta|nr:integration host factor subunit beta [Deltaproteobacteria bacterium]